MRGGIQIILSYFPTKNICYGDSMEVPQRSPSNKYPQYMFSRKNIITFGLRKYLISRLSPEFKAERIAPDYKRENHYNIISYFSTNTYVVGTH